MSFDNPYEIMGCKETDSIGHIEYIYKGYMKLLHPDKANTYEAKRLGMSQEEKSQYLTRIIEAYKTIKTIRGNGEFPDYKVSYKEEHVIKLNDRFDESDKKEVNNSKFNNIFSEHSNSVREAGMDDPYNKGYNIFDTGKDFSGNNDAKVGAQVYSAGESVEGSKNVQKPKLKKDNRLREYVPAPNIFLDSSSNYQELGITDVSDFSMTIHGKSGINGTDLMSVYGKNLEPWETTFKRDQKLYSKYTDDQDVKTKAAQIQIDRAEIYNLPPDKKIEMRENKYIERLDRREQSRLNNLKTRDEYYNELDMGRLGSGDPLRRM